MSYTDLIISLQNGVSAPIRDQAIASDLLNCDNKVIKTPNQKRAAACLLGCSIAEQQRKRTALPLFIYCLNQISAGNKTFATWEKDFPFAVSSKDGEAFLATLEDKNQKLFEQLKQIAAKVRQTPTNTSSPSRSKNDPDRLMGTTPRRRPEKTKSTKQREAPPKFPISHQ